MDYELSDTVHKQLVILGIIPASMLLHYQAKREIRTPTKVVFDCGQQLTLDLSKASGDLSHIHNIWPLDIRLTDDTVFVSCSEKLKFAARE